MKRSISILVLILSLALAIPAQAQIKFGIKGGVNLAEADLSGSALRTSNHTGFFIGPIVDIKVPIVGLGVDGALLYSQRGVKIAGESQKEKGLEVPINLKYSIGLSSLASVYLAAGPSFFFNFEGDDDFDGGRFDKKNAQLAFNLGAGVRFLKHYQVGANYNIPVSKTAEFKKNGGEYSYKTKGWQVSAAYFF